MDRRNKIMCLAVPLHQKGSSFFIGEIEKEKGLTGIKVNIS